MKIIYSASITRTYSNGDIGRRRITLVGNYSVGDTLPDKGGPFANWKITALTECGSMA